MSKIIELREKRAKVWEQAKAFLDEKRGENGLLSAEDTATYEKMEVEVVNLGKEVERLERQAAIDLELSKATSTALKTAPGADVKKQDEYTRAFWNAMRRPVVNETDRQSLTVGTDSEGGYLAPDEFERTLIEALEEENVMRTLAKIIKTSSGDRKIPVVASKGTATWVDEEGPIIESGDTFTQVTIGAYKLATMIKVSEELLNDSVFDLSSYIAKEFGRRIGAKEEEAFFIGDGEGKPIGIFNSTGGAQLGATTTKATEITADELLDLFYSLKAPYRKKAVFVMNDATVKAIRKLKDGTGQYLWQRVTRS
jgi:HK97 family phage major capsid protein